MIECVNPEDYPDIWKYNIWLEGKWSNLANVTRCIDPNICYDDPPALPKDFSVYWNQTLAKPNTVNTTLNYTCGRKCEYKKINHALLFFFDSYISMSFLQISFD